MRKQVNLAPSIIFKSDLVPKNYRVSPRSMPSLPMNRSIGEVGKSTAIHVFIFTLNKINFLVFTAFGRCFYFLISHLKIMLPTRTIVLPQSMAI
jgi:hypothetical protein